MDISNRLFVEKAAGKERIGGPRSFSFTHKLFTFCALTVTFGMHADAAGETVKATAHQLGPFDLEPAATLYLAKEQDAPATARVSAYLRNREKAERLLVRALDPEEQVSFWNYSEPVSPLPALAAATQERGEFVFDSDVPMDAPGIHQIRLVGGARNSSVSVAIPEEMGWGITFQKGNWRPWEAQPEEMYLYIPPHTEQVVFSGGPLLVFDDEGKLIAESKTNETSKVTTIPADKSDVVWRVKFPDKEGWRLRASASFPFILCSTPEAAKAIKGSVEVMPDGTVLAWKFQREILSILPELLKTENVGKTEDLLFSLADRESAWLENPQEGVRLMDNPGVFSAIHRALKEQNLDPNSHWAGAMTSYGKDKTWMDLHELPGAEGRWDRLRSIPHLKSGISPHGSGAMAENLAEVATIDSPLNPWFGRKELLYRAAAASLADLLALSESEVWTGEGPDLDPYAGGMAFAVAQKTFPTYELAAQHMPEDVQSVWTKALRHIVDRMFPEQLLTCRNQAAHFPLAWQMYANGSGSARYEEIARAQGRRLVEGRSAAGYHMEQVGPDSSYIGMTHWNMAVEYQMSGGDPVILDGLKKSYQFFNHTVAPEPNGSMLGSFNFNHRIGAGFNSEQWGGAQGILDEDLPEAAIWGQVPYKKIAMEARVEKIPAFLRSELDGRAGTIATPRYKYRTEKPDLSYVWPAREKSSFTRNFGDELIAVRRPGYYASIFVGHPAKNPHYFSSRVNFREPSDAETQGGEPNIRKITPYLGGGLSNFWTPGYGNAVLGTNWNPLAQNGLVAFKEDGTRWWADYLKTEFVLDKTASTLRVSGKIEDLPLLYERNYRFGDQQMEVEIKITAKADVSLASLVEIIPIAQGRVKANGAEIELQAAEGTMAKSFVVRDKSGQGVAFNLSEAHPIKIDTNGMHRHALKMAHASIELPKDFKKGESVTLAYTVSGFKAE